MKLNQDTRVNKYDEEVKKKDKNIMKNGKCKG